MANYYLNTKYLNLDSGECFGGNYTLRDEFCRKNYPINVTEGYQSPITLTQVKTEDWLVFSFFFVAVLVVGIAAACCNRGSINGFFSASRSSSWIIVGVSMFVSDMGSHQMIGVAATAAESGIIADVSDLNAIFIVPLLGWVFMPVYFSSGISTLPEYLRLRFGGRRLEMSTSCLALFMYIFTKISADLYAAIFYLEEILNFNAYGSVFLLLTVSALFAAIGGMASVIWTNAVQSVVILTGSLYLMITGKVGGIEGLFAGFMEAKPDEIFINSNVSQHNIHAYEAIEKCGEPVEPSQAFHLWQPANSNVAPWPGVLLGSPILSLWYWCSNQVIVQHLLASKDLSHAKLSCLLTISLKLIQPFILVLPGMAARVIYKDLIACSDPVLCCCFCESQAGCTMSAYSSFARDNSETTLITSPGARGLMAITVTAAALSSNSANFNACSAIFTIDIWGLIRPKATVNEFKIVGRVFIIIVCAVSIFWMTIIAGAPNISAYIQMIIGYFSPPVAAVYLLAIIWPRCTEKGAYYSLMIGFLIGLIRFILEISYPTQTCVESKLNGYDLRPPTLRNVHYLHFAVIVFIITIVAALSISIGTKAPEKFRTHGLTFRHRYQHRIRRNVKRKTRRGRGNVEDKDKYPLKSSLQENRRLSSNKNSAAHSSYPKTVSVRDLLSLNHGNAAASTSNRWENGTDKYEKGGKSAMKKVSSARTSQAVKNSLSSDNSQEIAMQIIPLASGLAETADMRLISTIGLIILMAVGIFLWVLLL